MAEFLGLNIWELLLAFAIVFFILKKFFSQFHNMPPHIPGIPILGNIFQVRPLHLGNDLTQLSKKYGDIFTVSIFGKKMICLNSEKLILDMLVNNNEDVPDRVAATYAIKKTLYDLQGLSFSQWGPSLNYKRRIISNALIMVGEQREQIQSLIQEEGENLVEIFDGYNGASIDPMPDLQAAVINVISVLTIGKRFEREEPEWELLQRWVPLVNKIISSAFGWELDAIPFLRMLPLQSNKTIDEAVRLRDIFIEKHYLELKKTFQKDSLRCMADHMIKNMNENEDGDITETVIKAVIVDIIFAGAATTICTTSSAIAILVNRQDIQKRIQKEIDETVGQGSMPSLKPKHDMPYLQAFLLEVLRYVTVATLFLRTACRDFKFQGYFIPKGTAILFNLSAAFHDSRYWKDPYTVDPTRFLDQNGQLVPPDHHNRKRLMTFGVGKRACVGEVFAKNRIVLFLSLLLQRFSFLPADGEPLPADNPRKFVPSLLLKPPPFKIRVARRT